MSQIYKRISTIKHSLKRVFRKPMKIIRLNKTLKNPMTVRQCLNRKMRKVLIQRRLSIIPGNSMTMRQNQNQELIKIYISETSEQNADKPKDIRIKSKTSFEKKESYQLSRSGSVNKK